jgi:predicted P-loop ATPase
MAAQPEKKKPEKIIRNMAERIHDSNEMLDDVAAHLARAADVQRKFHKRMKAISQNLKTALDNHKPNKTTYLEYLEFASAAEFKRFKNLSPISQEEIEGIDWDELTDLLQAS